MPDHIKEQLLQSGKIIGSAFVLSIVLSMIIFPLLAL